MEIGMHNIGGSRCVPLKLAEPLDKGWVVPGTEADESLPVRKPHLLIFPKRMPQRKERLIALRLEKARPIALPLLVAMPLSPLKWNRGGESDNGRKAREVFNKRLGPCDVEMLGELETESEVEATAQIQRLREIVLVKSGRQ